MSRLIDLTGKRFTRLVVRELASQSAPIYWHCDCDCGGTKTVQGGHLKTGNVASCGCLARELTSKRSIKHGLHNTKEYKTWQQMKERCLNQKSKNFSGYGGRGISVFDGWISSFDLFLSNVGLCPPECKSLDRINNNGNYEPGNVRWATPAQQSRNTRATKLTTEQVIDIRDRLINGELQSYIAELYKLNQQHVSKIANGHLWKGVGQTP